MSDLATEVRTLSGETRRLAVAVDQLTTRATRSERGIVGIAIALVVDVVLTGAIVWGGLTVQALANCQERQYEAFRDALAARAATSDQQTDTAVQQLQNQLGLFATLGAASTQAQREAAGAAYQRSVADQVRVLLAAKAARASNPLPQAGCQ